MYEIKKGVPFPTKSNRPGMFDGCKYPFEKMEKMDCFEVEDRRRAANVMAASYQAKHRGHLPKTFKIATRPTKDGKYLCFRVK